ncbi:MAG: acetoacetate--CoA ligase, partial [Rhodospirillaceae bacterium]|nr:acetoacetate--CoA ligase [Rhodospirillaceae bacterium]
MNTKLWNPTKDRIDATLLSKFMHSAERKFGISLPSYDAAWEWSINSPEEFWHQVWDFCEVISEGQPGPAIKTGDELIDAEFFPQARLNFARNLLRRTGNEPA